MPAQKGFAHIFLIIMIVAVTAGVAAYYFVKNYNINPKTNSETFTSNIQITLTPALTPKNSLFSGKIYRLDSDLGLLIQTPDQKLNKEKPHVVYYFAGTYTKGKYEGYTRYIAIRSVMDPSGPGQYIFASNDQKKYILDKTSSDNSNYSDLYFEIDKNKVEKIESLESDFPDKISLDQHFALHKNKLVIDDSNKIEDLLKRDFSNLSILASPFINLTLYTDKNISEYQQELVKSYNWDKSYLQGLTNVVAVDSTGVPYSYDLSNPQSIDKYLIDFANYKKEVIAFEKLSSEEKRKVGYPEYVDRPGLKINKQEIQTSSPVFNTYGAVLSYAGTLDVNTWVSENINDSDLNKIGIGKLGDIYILKNNNHPLLKAQYKLKTESGYYEEINKTKKPTYEEYISKNPVLFVKDYWNRWVVLGEYDIKLAGGLGKPVVYLYPEKPTVISVKFIDPIKFTVTIPFYKNDWKVLANPDGKLTDLQPELTDCSKIDAAKKGSEYAYSACLVKTYPYLYWAGQVLDKTYPKPSGGWVVAQKDVAVFLSNKFDEIGFNINEKKDFLEYWVPELLSKNSPFYKIAFLQTKEMNYLAPMQVSPTPKSVYRIFMDYDLLSSKPEVLPIPEQLDKIKRDGFTLIEWGGLKR